MRKATPPNLCHTRPSGGTFVKYQYRKISASCRGFSADCLASVPDSPCSMADLRTKGTRLRLGHLRVGKLHHWHLYLPCIALDLPVQFKLLSGIRSRTQLGSSVPHCIKWADEQYSLAGLERRLLPDLPLPKAPFGSLTLCQVLSSGRQRKISSTEWSLSDQLWT